MKEAEDGCTKDPMFEELNEQLSSALDEDYNPFDRVKQNHQARQRRNRRNENTR